MCIDRLRELECTWIELPLMSYIKDLLKSYRPPAQAVMRPEYSELLEEWDRQRKHETFDELTDQNPGIILLGSPGVGKSVFLSLLVEYELSQADPPPIVWYKGSEVTSGCFVWQKKKKSRTKLSEIFEHL